MLGHNNISQHLVFDVLFYERKDCPLKGNNEATINSLSVEKYLNALKNMLVDFVATNIRHSAPVNSLQMPVVNQHKQFTENASVALQQTINY